MDPVTGVNKPTYKRPFIATSLGSSNVYQTISMMMVRHVLCVYVIMYHIAGVFCML